MSDQGSSKGAVFIVSAPSGAGKTTLCNMAVDHFKAVSFSVSHTTRPPRDGEVDGRDYHFVGDDRFTKMVAAGEFLEHAEVHGNRYGTSKKEVDEALGRGEDVLLEIDVQGAEQIRDKVDGGVFIFIVPPSKEECERRLTSRGKDSPEVIKERLGAAMDELRKVVDYDHIVINDDLDEAFSRFVALIESVKRGAEEAPDLATLKKVKEIFGF